MQLNSITVIVGHTDFAPHTHIDHKRIVGSHRAFHTTVYLDEVGLEIGAGHQIDRLVVAGLIRGAQVVIQFEVDGID